MGRMKVVLLLQLCLWCVFVSASESREDQTQTKVEDPAPTPYWRPQLHFTPEINWTNDPNGLIYDEFHHVWHLFNQYNPWSIQSANKSWGHSISFDLVNWIELPVALYKDSVNQIYSGTAVFDYKNTSGLCNPNIPYPCLIPIWAGQGASLETVNIAYSVDPTFTTYKKYEGNPVIPSTWANFRDPAVFWYDDASHPAGGWWVAVVARSDISQVHIYNGPNLINWTLVSTFGPDGLTTTWECPSLFPIVVEETDTKMWVLWASAYGSTVEYFVGSFDGQTFTPSATTNQTGPLRVDFGLDFYASIIFNNAPNDRRIVVGWMSSPGYAGALPTFPWRCSFSFPRELTLHNDTDMNGKQYLRLHSTPVKELEMYRQQVYTLSNPVYVLSAQSPSEQNLFAKDLNFAGSRVCEVNAVFSIPQKPLDGNLEFGFYFRADANRNNYTTVGINLTFPLTNPSVYLDRRNSGLVTFANNFAAIDYNQFPFRYDPSGANYTLDIKVLLDTSSIEIFVQDGSITAGYLIFPYDKPDNDEVVFWVKSGGVLVNYLNVIDYATSASTDSSEKHERNKGAESILDKFRSTPWAKTM